MRQQRHRGAALPRTWDRPHASAVNTDLVSAYETRGAGWPPWLSYLDFLVQDIDPDLAGTLQAFGPQHLLQSTLIHLKVQNQCPHSLSGSVIQLPLPTQHPAPSAVPPGLRTTDPLSGMNTLKISVLSLSVLQ